MPDRSAETVAREMLPLMDDAFSGGRKIVCHITREDWYRMTPTERLAAVTAENQKDASAFTTGRRRVP